jgi:very-short-patch-repair endonuclease
MSDVVRLALAIHGSDRPDARVAWVAARQHGVVAYRQLVGLGLARGAIEWRIAARRLHRLHVGVYAVGHANVSAHGSRLAAVLACGPGALLSHRSAAAHLGLGPVVAGRLDVTCPGRTRVGHRGIAIHLPRRLNAEDATVHEGIPVTSLPRTLLDLAQVLGGRDVERALDAAERLHRFDLGAADRLLERTRGHRGRGRFARALRNHRPAPTRSELERRFLELCRNAGLPHPLPNTMVAGIEVDALWPHQRLVVELDGHAFHRTPLAFETDRRRDTTLQLSGYRVLRFTHRRLHDEPGEVVQTLRDLLSRSPERPGRAPGANARAPRAGPAS